MENTRCEVSIGDVCKSISDTYHGNDTDVVLVNTSDVFEGHVLNHETVPNKNLKGQFKKTFKRNDILYSEIRPANKRFAFIDFDDTSNYIASTKLMVLRPDIRRILPKYLFAILKSKSMLDELQHLAETRSGTFPQITFSGELAPMNISLPDLSTQNIVVKFLDSIENKIEVNNAINKNLMEQASVLYKAWFEDFILFNGLCPPMWKQGILADIANITSGKRPPVKSAVKTDTAAIPLVGAASVMGYTSDANHTDKILVTGRVGTHGVVQRFESPCWTSDNTLVITSDVYEYTYQILQRIDYHSMNRGSTQPLITQGDMNKVSVLIPDQETLNEYETLVGQLMEQYQANILENNKLAEMRDTLLPRLMSGELDVSELDL